MKSGFSMICQILPKATRFMSTQTSAALNTNIDKSSVMTIEEVRKQLQQYVQIHQSFGRNYTHPDRGDRVPQSELPPRRPSDSFVQCRVPMWDKIERPRYLSYQGGVRIGRLLEDLDILAGVICYKHDKNPTLNEGESSPYAFVTLMCEEIAHVNPRQILTSDKDVYLSGQVTWVGKSTVECSMNIEQEVKGRLEKIIGAKYMMAARNPAKLTAGTVNPLIPETDEQRELYNIAEGKRDNQGENATLFNSPPTDEERKAIHELFLATLNHDLASYKESKLPNNTVWMGDTNIKSILRCHPEDVSVYNRIFGGTTMMRAVEIASTAASFFAQCNPKACTAIDDVKFWKPLESGDVLHLCSTVVYSKAPDVQVHVRVEVMRPENGTKEVTNDFHFTFDTGLSELPTVAPKTYGEAMMYLVGKRHYEGRRNK